MKKFWAVFIISFLSGCMNSHQDPEIIIGGILPLSGKAVQYGDLLQKVANLRIEQINESGILTDKKIRIIWKDAECDYESGQEAAKELVEKEGVSVILGGACSDETLGAALITNPRRVLLISPTATAPALTGAGEYVFRTTASGGAQGRLLAYYSIDNKLKKVGSIWESNRYTDPIYNSFMSNFDQEVVEERIGGDDVYIPEVVSRLRVAEVEAIFLNSYSPIIIEKVLEEIKKQKYEVTILGNSLAVNTFKNMLAEDDFWVQQSFVGAHFMIDPETEKFQKFVLDYEARYAEKIRFPDFAGTMLDAVDLLSDAFAYVDNAQDTKQIKDYFHLTQHIGFFGGVIFDKNGDINLPNKLTVFNGENFVEYKGYTGY